MQPFLINLAFIVHEKIFGYVYPHAIKWDITRNHLTCETRNNKLIMWKAAIATTIFGCGCLTYLLLRQMYVPEEDQLSLINTTLMSALLLGGFPSLTNNFVFSRSKAEVVEAYNCLYKITKYLHLSKFIINYSKNINRMLKMKLMMQGYPSDIP